MRSLILCLACTALPAAAQDERILSADEFQDFIGTSTVYYGRNGNPYGAEQYLPNRKVIWSFLNNECQYGVWYDRKDQICFIYEGQSSEICWHFMEVDGNKAARVIGDDPENDLVALTQNDEPLHCPGPDVGVSYTPKP